MKKTIFILSLIITHLGFSQVTDTGGNVGIGTTTPSDKLEVVGDITIQGSNASDDGPLRALKFFNSYVSSNSVLAQIQARRGRSSHQKGDLAFYVKNGTSLVEALRIASDGNLGIGTSTPAQKLSIQGDNTSVSVSLSSYNYASSIPIGAQFGAWDSSFTNAAGTKFHRYRGGANSFANGYIGQAYAGGEWGLDFRIENQTSASNPTESRLFIKPNGNIGIGTTIPSSKLEIKDATNSQLSLVNSTGNLWQFRAGTTGSLIFKDDNVERIRIDALGNLGIGTSDTKGFKLGVQGKIAAEEVKVAVYANWADFVFNKDYNLPTLKDVEQHIKDKGHLKDIPSAEAVKKNGIFLGEMDAKLLMKIEELMLYTIQQQKEIEAQNNKIERLESENAKLQSLSKRLTAIEKALNH